MTDSIEARNLIAGYGAHAVLGEIDFVLPQGELAVLIGANGSGKSTLLRTLSGNQAPVSGTVCIDGKDIARYSRRDLARHLAIVLTGRSGGGALTVEECVAIGRHVYTGPFGHLSATDRQIVADSLRSVGMDGKAKRYLGTLSDGERQKTMIARALAQQAPSIILDEPTAFLDVAGRIEIINLLRRLADDGHAVLLSTHDIAPAIAEADKLLVIDAEAHVLKSGRKADIIGSGVLDRAFAPFGLHFDLSKGDFVK